MKEHWPASTQLSPLPAVLVTASRSDGSQSNLMTAAWTGIICSQPPMCYVSIRPERFTYGLILESREFALNVTTVSMAKATDLAGVISGKNDDKWQRTGLTPIPAKEISCPLIQESPLSLECKVKDIIDLGSHHMFIADIVSVAVDRQYIDPQSGKFDLAASLPISYSHGEYFAPGDFLGYFGWSIKKDGKIQRR